jgi:hypothetical protein
VTPEQSKHYETIFDHVVQPLQSDVRRIFDYEDFTSIPAPLKSPLAAAELAPYLDQDRLITFTVRVPLSILAGGGEDLLAFITDIAFAEPVTVTGFECRAIGAAFTSFDEQLSGHVHLQVTGELSTQ